MSLYDLLNNITIQGAIRLSQWDGNNDEHILFQTDGTDDFGVGDIESEWEDLEVLYIFTAGDGYLHIEVESTE